MSSQLYREVEARENVKWMTGKCLVSRTSSCILHIYVVHPSGEVNVTKEGQMRK